MHTSISKKQLINESSLNNTSSLEICEIQRPYFTQDELEREYSAKKQESDNILRGTLNYIGKYYKPSGPCMKSYWLDRFPFIKWVKNYNLKEYALPDVISGLTIGIVHIPQGLAYALLASLPAVTGLYVSFFAVMMYVMLGTSNHLSMGTFAITSLMTSQTLAKFDGIYYPSAGAKLAEVLQLSNNLTLDSFTTETIVTSTVAQNSKFLSNNRDDAKIMLSICLTFFTGLFQVIFAILHVGCVTKYLSEVIVTGFTTGAAVHIVTSQVPALFGFTIGNVKMPFKFIGALIEIFSNIGKTNLSALIVSAVSIFILAVVREQINDRFKSKMIMPVPIELIVVIFGTLFSYLFGFNEKWNIRIVGEVKRGIPAPVLPNFSLASDLIGDAISIAIVSFAINISMAKLFAKKYKYEISPNQELIAYGAGNIVSSFFQGFPACVALSRCAILESTGAKTQAYSFISSIMILIVCLVIGPLFRTLPNACLAAIIVVALKNMLLQITQIPSVYRTSKLEALAWVITFLGVVVFDVDIGLYIGIGASLLMFIIRTQRPRAVLLGNIPGTEIYDSIEVFKEALEIQGMKIIRYEESLYYANVENFKYQVMKLSDVNPAKILQEIKSEQSKFKKPQQKIPKKSAKQLSGSVNLAFEDENEANFESQQKSVKDNILKAVNTKIIILDCSPFNFIDSMGVNAIIQLYEAYRHIDVSFHLVNCKPNVMKMFKKLSFEQKANKDFIYPTTHDAITFLLSHKMQNGVLSITSFEVQRF